MATLSSKLIISLVDRASGPAQRLRSQLTGLQRDTQRHFAVISRSSREAGAAIGNFAMRTAAAGYGVTRFLDAVKEFNEAEWGYTFARIPDHFKGLTLDMESLRKEASDASDGARAVAKDLGLLPEAVMQARTEVEKVGRSGQLGDSMWRAALGLNMADNKMPTDTAVKYLNAMYSSYEKQRVSIAQRMGLDLNDERQRDWFDRHWLRGTAAKSAFAAAKSALDPGDLVEGARQYAPQWASLGMSPEEVLGALAHGSNYGFRAPELGTAFKSWANKLVKPTAAGQRWINTLGMDRRKWSSGMGPADPMKASTALNSLLGNQLYAGKGGKDFKAEVRTLLDDAAREGTTASPEFQGRLAAMIEKRLGKGWAGRGDDIADAVMNATLTPTGDINIMEFIREGLKKGMTRAAMLEVLEGRHIARNTPMFEYFDNLVEMVEGLQKIDGMHLDAIEQERKGSRAGKLTAMYSKWSELLLKFQDSGASDRIVSVLSTLFEWIGKVDPQIVKIVTTFGLLAIALGPVVSLLRMAWAGLKLLGGALGVIARLAGFGVKGGAVAAGATAAEAAAGLGAGTAGAASARKLFSMRNQKAGSAAANRTAADRLSQMGRANHGARITAGMSEAGRAAEMGAGKAGAKVAGKLGMRLIPGIGLVIGLGAAAYEAYEGYQKDGWKGAILNPLTLGMYSSRSEASEAPGPTIASAGQDAAVTMAQQSANQIRSILAAVDLTAEGKRIMDTLASGMRAGIASVQSAASEAAAAAAGSALRGAYSDGAR